MTANGSGLEWTEREQQHGWCRTALERTKKGDYDGRRGVKIV
ncbi:hypothetical protein L195_g062933, partial [Trifolium pratense]